MKNVNFMLAILMLATTTAFAGEVYKWKDAEGNIHFSAKPPMQNRETMEIKEYKGAGTEEQEANNQYSDDINKSVAEMRTAMEKELRKVDETEKTIDCSAAMSNLNWQFDAAMSQGRRNLQNGSITQDQYNQVASQLSLARKQVSYSKCQSAKGVERSFYECMSNNKNHFVGCGERYNFD